MKKKFVKRLAAGIFATVLTVGALAGCGSKAVENTAAQDAAVEETTVQETAEPEAPAEDAAKAQTKETGTDEAVAAEGEVTTIYAATGGSPKPFTFVDDSNELTGHNIELIKAIFDKLPQYKLEIEVTDFASIFAGLDSDRYQIGVNNFAKNEQRKEKYLFTDPIFANEYVAIFAKDNKKAETIESWDDLAGLKTISQAGINITTALENYNTANPDKSIVIEYSESDLVLQIQDVEAGKYDFVLMDKPMFEYYQNEFNFNVTGITISNDVSKDLMEEPYSYLIVSAGNEQLVDDINKALKEVIEEGTSKEINEKWFGSDYSPSYE
ncbi:polar amino acid transport system substrate-binding protein [Kineothrix alysoides]|uniref:Polar amino acid transport system substrate-binding protein n=1 Tax=Kineothrix alysoides TaxID=1469948 RepID=A0A4R1R183_9FIRM|nr:transporter substrate-binding domain-containing protein [Kineothrix alysoides]TCL59086.1 polar amino acid transport system substrate-binding protein [Kineothrix alysoides]